MNDCILVLNCGSSSIKFALFNSPLPMQRTPLWSGKAFVFNPESSTINAIILILAIGMPLSFIASQYYSKQQNQV